MPAELSKSCTGHIFSGRSPLTEYPWLSRDFDRVIRLAVMYLLIVVPVSALKIRQM